MRFGAVYRLTEFQMDEALNLRHATPVRVTHWINTFSFLALLVSGAAILMAHPRLYWGETGAFGTPPLMDLPIPLNTDQSGWGRSLHFLAAWIAVLNGMVYVLFGLLTGHFRSNMVQTYNALQRLAYLGVIFVLFPLMIGTGLAMSPAVMAVLPALVGFFGGHQSARTIHFVVMDFLVLFLMVHVAMVYFAGFRQRMGAMIIDRGTAQP
jgi:thiosulfate reductase cytochrome b subunit